MGHSKGKVEQVPGCRGPGAAGEEAEDGLRGCLRLTGQAGRLGDRPPVVPVGLDIQEAM